MAKLDWQFKSKIRFWLWTVNHNPIHQIGLQSRLSNPTIQSSNTLTVSWKLVVLFYYPVKMMSTSPHLRSFSKWLLFEKLLKDSTENVCSSLSLFIFYIRALYLFNQKFLYKFHMRNRDPKRWIFWPHYLLKIYVPQLYEP